MVYRADVLTLSPYWFLKTEDLTYLLGFCEQTGKPRKTSPVVSLTESDDCFRAITESGQLYELRQSDMSEQDRAEVLFSIAREIPIAGFPLHQDAMSIPEFRENVQ